ncbi:oligopeptide transporter ATP-binding protein OppD [Acetobacter tropicalis NBRC 101654]|uniref:Oligopeptide transporter ATP-binding protein OppD n=1 Tax=Acetobacter tropicalis NBRC 101654 TaxID=749388 RepID=F7VFE1_9PROT|nr:ABC transporter ATP-binding protein [Acetobacter tropicalis]GAA09086.1 oligopeptide transporter ATP-binding protein OppD [Acetobacter tropicalis NBRC 101654]
MTAHIIPLQVQQLSVGLPHSATPCTVLHDLSFDVQAGEILGVVGESGSGKTTLGLACLGLLPPVFHTTGHVLVAGRNFSTVPEKVRYRLRGHGIGYVPQEPMKALNPGMTVGAHIAETLPTGLGKKERLERVDYWLAQVGLMGGASMRQAYPFALSGGQRQRVLLAAALAGEPAVLIADEFTTALDPATRRNVVLLLKNQAQKRNMAVVLISHDLELVAHNTDTVLVLRGGQCVEYGPTQTVLARPTSSYLQALLALSLQFTPRPPLSLFEPEAIRSAQYD